MQIKIVVVCQWAALRSTEWKLIDHPTGTDELYDLVNDPYELESLHADSAYTDIKSDMQARLNSKKGLNISTFRWNVPDGNVGKPYSFQLDAWGGTKPYSWSITSGQLPPGISLNRDTGLISGTPASSGIYKVYFEVQGAGLQTQSGRPQVFKSLEYVFDIKN